MAEASTLPNTITLDLVTPERVIESRAVEMVVIPGKEGDFGVLAGHAPMISSLRPGVVRIYEGSVVIDRVLVTAGFAEVTQSRCTILATEAYRWDDALEDKVKARFEAAQRAFERAREEDEKKTLGTDASLSQELFDAFVRETDGK